MAIRVYGKYTFLGLRNTAEGAHKLYADAARRFYGEFARVS